MTDASQVAALYHQRRIMRHPVFARMLDVMEHYNGDVVYPLPELDKAEKSFVANLLTQGLDQMAMRAASTMPDVYYPSSRPGIGTADERARVKRLANLGWWDMNRINLKMRRRARFMLGYSCSPVMIRPDFKRSIPSWAVRNPLSAFPPPMPDPEDITPHDCIFTTKKTLGWLRDRYPAQMGVLYKGKDPSPDLLFEVLEYVDDVETILVVLGQEKDERSQTNGLMAWQDTSAGVTAYEELDRVPNRSGVCPVVFPGRITLDKPMGLFDSILGIQDMQAKMMALETIAIQRSIFPDEYLVGRPQEQPVIVRQANGLTGEMGVVKGGLLQTQQVNPGVQAQPFIDRLERNARVGSSLPAEFGGESASNIRTARRGEAILSSAVDMPIQETQEIFAASLQEENVRAVAVAKAWFGSKKMSFYVGSKGARQNVDYVPNDTFDSDVNIVRYSAPGSDVNGMIVSGGQMVGMGALSKRTFMEMSPYVEDPEREHAQVVQEALEQAQLASLQQQAEQGQLPPNDLARIQQLVLGDHKTLAEAVIQAHQEAQARQAAQAPPPGPGQATAPGQQPGLAQPGAGAEQAASAPIGPPAPSSANLQALLATLHNPQAAAQSPAPAPGPPQLAAA